MECAATTRRRRRRRAYNFARVILEARKRVAASSFNTKCLVVLDEVRSKIRTTTRGPLSRPLRQIRSSRKSNDDVNVFSGAVR
jgi:hypothetical protein